MVPNTINNKNIYGIKNCHMSQYLPSHFETKMLMYAKLISIIFLIDEFQIFWFKSLLSLENYFLQ